MSGVLSWAADAVVAPRGVRCRCQKRKGFSPERPAFRKSFQIGNRAAVDAMEGLTFATPFDLLTAGYSSVERYLRRVGFPLPPVTDL